MRMDVIYQKVINRRWPYWSWEVWETSKYGTELYTDGLSFKRKTAERKAKEVIEAADGFWSGYNQRQEERK